MTGESPSAAQPRLNDDTKAFVRRAISAGVTTIDEIKTVVSSLMADEVDFTPERLAEGLVGAGILTRWQSSKLLAGRSKGFFLGTYKLLRPLGKGGMGMVYLGEHHVMKRQMALKIMPKESLTDERRIERFKEEARASAQLDHPNIVRAYDFNESSGKLYIVMEFVDGIDLHQAVMRDGVMDVDAALDAVHQAALGLAQAHEQGIIHRDIKPSNLMLRSDGVVKVSDMGLARIGWGETSVEGEKPRLTGTADFIAPEQALNSKTVDARADIYSLGCTFYFLLTAQPPFKGQTVAQRLAKHQTAAVPDVRLLRPDCPQPIAALLMRMMAKRPADRPRSAVELISHIERAQGGKATHAGSQKQLAALASMADTRVDERFYQASIQDTSFSDSNESLDVPMASPELDFGSLPSVVPVSGPVAQFRGGGTGASGGRAGATALASPKSAAVRAGAGGESQWLLLGVGLTVAVLALLTVVGMAVYTVTKPDKPNATKIKATEDGKGGHIVILQSSE